jgi:hypothetical protein
MLKKNYLTLLITLSIVISPLSIVNAQLGQQQLWQTMQMRLGESYIRVAEPGEIADTVHIWGDVAIPGNYIVPRGSSVAEVISYARGPARTVSNAVQLDWSQLRMDIVISHYDEELKKDRKELFQYKYNDAVLPGMRSTIAQNRDIIVVEVKRKPIIVDWLGVIGPIISAISGVVSLYVILSRL